MKMRKLYAMVMTLVMLVGVFSVSVAANTDADERTTETIAEEILLEGEETPSDFDGTLEENGMENVQPVSGLARGTGKPTKSWDISSDGTLTFAGGYTADRGGQLYTNYNFTGLSSGKLKIETSSVSKYTGDVTFTIYKNNLLTDTEIGTFTVNAGGSSKTITLSNFDTSSKYYVYFYSMSLWYMSGSISED